MLMTQCQFLRPRSRVQNCFPSQAAWRRPHHDVFFISSYLIIPDPVLVCGYAAYCIVALL